MKDCDGCMGVPGREVVKEEYVYAGSCLGPFKVKNATVFQCDSCGGVKLLASIAKSWEVDKALSMIEEKCFFNAIEMKFLRELCGLTQRELALQLDVDANDIRRWEDGIGASPGQSRLMARHLIRKQADLGKLEAVRAGRIWAKARMESED